MAACVAASVALLLVPATLAYDAWAWLVWGRELLHLELDTTGGPSWKPLPVILAVPLAGLGSLAPVAWLVLTRTLGLLSVLGAYRLARTLGGRSAGILAAGLLLLTPDRGPRFVRLVLEGHSAPVTAGLALWAVDRHLAARPGQALGLLTLLALDRPESWPFLGLYGLWTWRRHPRWRPLVAACVAAIPLLWFGVDWWGSGSPLHGADAAQVVTGSGRLGEALDRALASVVLPAWIAAGVALVLSVRAGRSGVAPGPTVPGRRPLAPTVPVLAAAALGWSVVAVAMSATLGYAALARFFLPAAALIVVVAAVGVVLAVESTPRGWRRAIAVAAIAGLSLPSVAARTSNLGRLVEEIDQRAVADRDLAAVVREADIATRLVGCPPLSMDGALVPRPALAWRAGLPLSAVRSLPATPAGILVVRTGSEDDTWLSVSGVPVTRLAQQGGWVVAAADCSSPDRP